jgi:hypothetical protein
VTAAVGAPTYGSSAVAVPTPKPAAIGVPTHVTAAVGAPTYVSSAVAVPTPKPSAVGMTTPMPFPVAVPTPRPAGNWQPVFDMTDDELMQIAMPDKMITPVSTHNIQVISNQESLNIHPNRYTCSFAPQFHNCSNITINFGK